MQANRLLWMLVSLLLGATTVQLTISAKTWLVAMFQQITMKHSNGFERRRIKMMHQDNVCLVQLLPQGFVFLAQFDLGLLLYHQGRRGGNQKDDQNAGDDFHHGTKSLHDRHPGAGGR
jgi:hypothetical protein